ncbi:hypothetical protein G6L28_20015 [Agrobacterium larrymoorei]|uniref:hypothetical protein n=1 Tax=Agrobacterium larrymoorei TaxID=160699 RepID=UPI0015732277|nr:hypothetical protein [Agrobacterium larrymoorei]NTJ44882.1 hypothetical protein [Agrobacterium larrymoorei]
MSEAIHTIGTEQRSLLQRLALLATGSTGADIERLVRGVRRKSRRQRRPLTFIDIEQALLAGQPRLSDDLRWRIAIHEVGHAIAFSNTGIAEVMTVSIGIAGMGQVISRQHQHLEQTEDWLMRKVACMLAGRTAELLIFGDTVAGAGGYDDSDLAMATDHAVAAETRLGFSNEQPLLYRSAAVTINELSLDRHLADRVNARLVAAEAIARDLLESQRKALITIAERLKGVGVMTGEEFRRLLGTNNRPEN